MQLRDADTRAHPTVEAVGAGVACRGTGDERGGGRSYGFKRGEATEDGSAS